MLAILLFPTYLMVIPIALMFVRKLSNNWIYGIHLLLLWGSAILFGILIYDADGQDGADSIFAGIMMGLFMLLCNTIQFNLVTRLLELHRCPDCHRMCLEKIPKRFTSMSLQQCVSINMSQNQVFSVKHSIL